MLDILMLEALLVVDDLPNSNIIKFETEMVESRKLGSIQEPAWGTRPVDVPEGRWRLMQENLYPNLVSIILLDGIKDDLEFRVRIDTEIDHNLMYSSNSVQPSEPLLESQYIWIISGISLVLLGIGIESKRRKNAKHLLRQFAYENKWD